MKRAVNTSGSDVTAALRAFLDAATSFVMIDLFAITLLTLGWPRDSAGNGLTLYYAQSEYDVPWRGNIYQGGYFYAGAPAHDPAPKIERGVLKTVLGTEVGTMDLTIMLDGSEFLPPAATGADPFGLGEALAMGLFEGAHVFATRLFLSNHPPAPITPAAFDIKGGITLFAGQVTDTKITRSKADLKVASYLERLNIGLPRNVYGPTCNNTLYDLRCTLSRTATPFGNPVQEVTTVLGSPVLTQVLVPVNSLQPAGYFNLGTLQFTSGAMAGLQRPIRAWDGATVELLSALPRVPDIGDGVILQRGCDKTEDTCKNVFDNFPNFAGYPKIPPADSAT